MVWRAHILLFFVSLFYAGNFTIAKEVMPEFIQPFGFIFMRVSTMLIVFLIYHRLFVKEKVDRKDIPKLALCGVFGVAINQMMFFKGLSWTMPINASLIMTTTPILVLLASALLLKEKITAQKILGIALGATGAILLIAYGNPVNISQESIWGDLMVFINAVSYAIYLVLVKSLMEKYHPITVVKWVVIFGFFYVTPFGIQEFSQIDWQSFNKIVWLSVAYVLFFATVLTYFFNASALKVVNPSTVSIYIYLQPLLATIIALALGKDGLNAIKILSSILIFTGVALVSFSLSKREKSKLEQTN